MFKWTERELQAIAVEMYKLMTNGRHSSVTDYWPAFKQAQAFINPSYKYSTNSQNTELMKELRRRVSQLFSDCKNKVEVKVVLDPKAATAKAQGILEKIKKIDENREKVAVINERVRIEPPSMPKVRKLITGNVVEDVPSEVMISVLTTCPKKWVIVDLETGDQYGSTGAEVKTSDKEFLTRSYLKQQFINPIRKLTIPKPKKRVNQGGDRGLAR